MERREHIDGAVDSMSMLQAALLPQYSAIKILLVVALALVLWATIRLRPGQRQLAIRRLALLGFLIFSFAAVIWPEVVTAIANWVGVGRGADLLLYLLVVVVFANLTSSYRRRTEIDDRLVRLARAQALANVKSPHTQLFPDVQKQSADATTDQAASGRENL